MMLERLVYDQMGRWPGRCCAGSWVAAGNPLFAGSTARLSERGRLADADPDLIEARFELDLRGTASRR